MGFLIRFFMFIFIKSFLKKLFLGIILFVFSYFGFEDLKILKSVVGQQDYEITQQTEIEMIRSEVETERFLRYRLSNTGTKALALKIKIKSKDEKIEYKLGDTFKIYSVTADESDISFADSRPYQNYLTLDVSKFYAGLGFDIYFREQHNNPNYFNELDIKVESPLVDGLYQHEKNTSPIKVMLLRFSLLFLICLTTSAVIFMFFGFIVSAIQDYRETPSLD